MAEINDVAVGDRWAYRQNSDSSRFHEALVITVGAKRPPRVRVELLADEWQGERRWISPSRLEVRWEDRHPHIELDRKAKALQRWTPGREERRTVEHIMLVLVPLEVAWYNADAHGMSTIYDVSALISLLGIAEDVLRAEPAYEHDGELFVPWPTTELIARTAAQLAPDRLLHEIEKEERQLNDEALHGVVVTDFDGARHELTPEGVRSRFEKYQRPRIDMLRDFIGVERADDLLERRALLVRLGMVVTVATEALDVLEPTQKRIVARLREQLNAALDGVNALPPSH